VTRKLTVIVAPETAGGARRILATRNAGWTKAFAGWLARAGVRPNSVSVAGVVFALGACSAFYLAPDTNSGTRRSLLLLAATTIQLRLLCNLLDGMLAVEQGLKNKTGDIYNDLPDRMADVLILVGAGYSIRQVPYGPTLGWIAATAALFTAYVRVLGGSLGVRQSFIGPMAKPHRMFTLTVATLISVVETTLGLPSQALRAALGLMAVGSIVTAWRRTRRIAAELRTR
jgi:phosphatidylglycerophosphate synthase